MRHTIRLLVLFMLFATSVPTCFATEKDSLNVPFKDRIAIHTNAVEWLLMTPNLGVEYSFIQNDLKKVSALLHGKYNPNSFTTFNPNIVYNIGGARGEVRWYYRTRHISQGEVMLDSLERAKYGAFKSFWKKLTTRPYSFWGKKNPRKHRAYYIGPYMAFDKYTIKLSKRGYQGYSFGFGATAGYSIPLYHYKDGSAVDFELGFSVGMAMSMNDMFTYNSDIDCYPYAGSKAFHVVPFPVLADARVGFVYRINSIREQITGINQEKLDNYAAIYELHKSYDEKITSFILPYHIEKVVENNDTVEKKILHDAYLPADSIRAWNKVVAEKNSRIREINKQALLLSAVDSTMLLEELRPYYEYIEVPEKMFSQYNHMIPNKDVEKVAELENEYLNSLLEEYAVVDKDVVKEETGLGQVEDPLLFSYGSLRSKLLEKNDSVSGIRLIDLMVHAVSNINSNVKFFNEKYNKSHSGKSVEYDALPVTMEVITGEAGKGYGLDFVFGVDTFALAQPQNYSFKALNDEIEAQNVYKLVAIEDLMEQAATKKSVADGSKKAQKAKKSKKIKEPKAKKVAAKKDVVGKDSEEIADSQKESETAAAVEPKKVKKTKKEKAPKKEKVKKEKKKKNKKMAEPDTATDVKGRAVGDAENIAQDTKTAEVVQSETSQKDETLVESLKQENIVEGNEPCFYF